MKAHNYCLKKESLCLTPVVSNYQAETDKTVSTGSQQQCYICWICTHAKPFHS